MEQDDNAYQANNEYFTFLGNDGKAFWQVPVMESTLNCSITFSDKFVTLQDRSTGKTIGIGRESQGLYHLTSDSSPAICISTDAPLLIHNRLGHPSLSKF